ncbi:unnamed protein product [Lymnaea stagnalis]|uniref:Protein kinase domain-containing protein n=1 Tax=Lymnaea stagnalis TaxID=6523 RepID=A0AAV2HBU3_LYMST
MSEDNGVKALRPSTFKITSKKNPTRSRSKTCGDTGVDTANTGSNISDFKTTDFKVEGLSNKADGDQLKRNRSESRTRPPGNVDTQNFRGRSQVDSGFDGTRAEKFTHRRAKSSLEGLSAHSYASRVLNQRHNLNILDAVIQQGLDKTQNFVNPRMNFGDGLLTLTSGENLIPNVIPPLQHLTEATNDGNVSTDNQVLDQNTVQAKVETLGNLDKLSPPHRMLEICANDNDPVSNSHKNRTQSEPPVRRFFLSPKNVVPCDTKAATEAERKTITKTNLDDWSSPKTRKGSSPSKKSSTRRADSLSPGDIGLSSLKSPGRKSKGKHRKKGKSRGNGRPSPTPTGDIYIPNNLAQFNIGKGVFDALTQENGKQGSPKGKTGSKVVKQGSPKVKPGSPGLNQGSPKGIPRSPKLKPGSPVSQSPPSSYRVHGTSNELEHKSGTFLKPKDQKTVSPKPNLACKVKGTRKCFREWQPEDSPQPQEEPSKPEKKPETSPGNGVHASPEKISPKTEQEQNNFPLCKSPKDPVCKKSSESTASASKPCLEQPPCRPCKAKKKRRHPCGWGDSNRGVSFTRKNFFGNIAKAVGDQLNCIAYRNSLFHSFPGMIGLYRPDIGMDSLFMNDSEEDDLEEEEEEKPKSRKSKEKESKRSEDKDDTSRQVSSDERMYSDKDQGQVRKVSIQQSGKSSFPSQLSHRTSIKTAATGQFEETEPILQNAALQGSQRYSQKEGQGGYYVEEASRQWRDSQTNIEISPRQMSRLSPRGETKTIEYDSQSPADQVKIVLEIPTYMRSSPRVDSTHIVNVPAPPPRHLDVQGSSLDSRRATGERATPSTNVTRVPSQEPMRRSTYPPEYEAHKNDLPMSPRFSRYSSPQFQDRQSAKGSVHFIPSAARDRASSYDQSLKSGLRSPNDYRTSPFLKSGSQSSYEEKSPSPSRLPGSADRSTGRGLMIPSSKKESSNLSEDLFLGKKLFDSSSFKQDSATERFSRSQTFKEDDTVLQLDSTKRSSRTIDNLTASSGRSSGSPYKTFSPFKADEDFTHEMNLSERALVNRSSMSKPFQEDYRSTIRDSPSRLSSRAASSERHSSVQLSQHSGQESPRGTYMSRQISKPASSEKFSRQQSFQQGSQQASDQEVNTRRTSARDLIEDKLCLIQQLSKEQSRRGSSQPSDEEAGSRQTSGRGSSQEGEFHGSSQHSSDEDRGTRQMSNRESRLERLTSNQRSSRPTSRITGSQKMSDEEGNTRQVSTRASRQTSIEKLSRAQSAREGSRQTSDNEIGTRPISTRESLEQRMSSIDKNSITQSLREISQQLSEDEGGTRRCSGRDSVQEKLTSIEKLSREQSFRDGSQQLSDEESGTRQPSTRESRQERLSSIEKLSREPSLREGSQQFFGSEDGVRRNSGRESRLERLTSIERSSRGQVSDEEEGQWPTSSRESFQERLTSFDKISRGQSQQNLEEGSTRRTTARDSLQERLTPVENISRADSVRDGSRQTSFRESRHERFASADKYSRAQSLIGGIQQPSDEEGDTRRASAVESRQERLSSVDRFRAQSQKESSLHISDEEESTLRTPGRESRQERLTSRTRPSKDAPPERIDNEFYRGSTLNETAIESSANISKFHSMMEDPQQRMPMEGVRDKSARTRSSSFIQENYDRETATFVPSVASSKQQLVTVAESQKLTIQDPTRWSGSSDFVDSPEQHTIPQYLCTVGTSSLQAGSQMLPFDKDKAINKPCRPEFMKKCDRQSPVTKSEIDQLRVSKEEKFQKSQSADECSKGLPHRDYQYPQCNEKLPKADKRSVSSTRPPIHHPSSARRVTMDDSCEQRYRDSKSRAEQGSDAKRFSKMRDISNAEDYDGRRDAKTRTFEASYSSPSRRSTKQTKHSRDNDEEETTMEPSLRSTRCHRVGADAVYEDESVTIASYETSTWRQTPTEGRGHDGYVEDEERVIAPSRGADNDQVLKVIESTDEDESYSEKLDTHTLDEPPSIDTDDNDKPEKAFYMRDKRRCRELTSGESGDDEPLMSARSKGRLRNSDKYNQEECTDDVVSKRGTERNRSRASSIIKVCFHKEQSGEHEDLEEEERCSDAVSSEECVSDDSCKELSSKNIPSGDSCAQRQIRKIKGRITFRCSDDTNTCPASRSTTVAIQNGTVQMITSPQGVKIIDCGGAKDCEDLSSETSDCEYMNNLVLSNNSRSARSQWADNRASDKSMKKYLRDSQYIRQRQLRLIEYEQDNTQSCDSLSDYLPSNRRKSPVPAPRMNLIKSYDYSEGRFTRQFCNFESDEQRGRDIYRCAYRSRSNSAKSDRSPESFHVRAIDPFRQVITPEQPVPVSDKYSARNIGEYIKYISPDVPYQRQADMFLCNLSSEKVDDIGSPEDICINVPKKLPETRRENPFLLVRSAFIPSDETDVTVVGRPRVKVRPKSASAKCSYRIKGLQSPMRIEASPGDTSESQTLSANSAMYRNIRSKYRDKTSNHGHFIPENESCNSQKSSPECTALSVAVSKNKNCSSNADRDRNSSSGSGDFMYSDLAYHCGVIDTLRLLDTDNVSSDSAKLSSVCDHSDFPHKTSFPVFSRMESEEHITELVRSLPSLAVGGHDDEAIEQIRQNSIRALLFAASLSNSWSSLRLFSSATAKDTAKWVQELKDRTTVKNVLSPQQSNATDSPTNDANISLPNVWKSKTLTSTSDTGGFNLPNLWPSKKFASPTDSNFSPSLQNVKPTKKIASPSKGTQSHSSHVKSEIKTSNKMTSPVKPEELQEPQSKMYTPKSTQFQSSGEYQQKPRTRAVKIQVQCSKNAAIQTQSIDRDTQKCDKAENTEMQYFIRDVEVSTKTSSELNTKSDTRNREKFDPRRGKLRRDPKLPKDFPLPKPGRRNERGQGLSHKTVPQTDLKDIFQLMTMRSRQESRGLRKKKCHSFNDTSSCGCSRRARSHSEDSVYYYKESRSPSPCHRIGHRTRSHSLDRMHRPRSRSVKTKKIFEGFTHFKPKSSSRHRFSARSFSAESVYHDRSDGSHSPRTDFKSFKGEVDPISQVRDFQNDLFLKRKFLYSTDKSLPNFKTRCGKMSERNYQRLCACSRCQQRRFELQRYIYLRKSFKGDKSSTKVGKAKYPLGACGDTTSQPTDKTKNNSKDFSGEERPFLDNVTIFVVTSQSSITANEENEREAEIRYFDDVDPCCRFALKNALRNVGSSSSIERQDLPMYALDDVNKVDDNSECVTDQDTDYFSSWKSYSSQSNNVMENDSPENQYFDQGEHNIECKCPYSHFSNDVAAVKKQRHEHVGTQKKEFTYLRINPDRRKMSHKKRYRSKSGISCTSLDSGLDKSSSVDGGNKCNSSKWVAKHDGMSDMEGEHNNLEFENVPEIKPSKVTRQNTNSEVLRHRISLMENENMPLDTEHDTSILTRNKDSLLDDPRDATEFQVSSRELFSSTISQFTGSDEVQIDELLKKYIHSKTESSHEHGLDGDNDGDTISQPPLNMAPPSSAEKSPSPPNRGSSSLRFLQSIIDGKVKTLLDKALQNWTSPIQRTLPLLNNNDYLKMGSPEKPSKHNQSDQIDVKYQDISQSELSFSNSVSSESSTFVITESNCKISDTPNLVIVTLPEKCPEQPKTYREMLIDWIKGALPPFEKSPEKKVQNDETNTVPQKPKRFLSEPRSSSKSLQASAKSSASHINVSFTNNYFGPEEVLFCKGDLELPTQLEECNSREIKDEKNKTETNHELLDPPKKRKESHRPKKEESPKLKRRRKSESQLDPIKTSRRYKNANEHSETRCSVSKCSTTSTDNRRSHSAPRPNVSKLNLATKQRHPKARKSEIEKVRMTFDAKPMEESVLVKSKSKITPFSECGVSRIANRLTPNQAKLESTSITVSSTSTDDIKQKIQSGFKNFKHEVMERRLMEELIQRKIMSKHLENDLAEAEADSLAECEAIESCLLTPIIEESHTPLDKSRNDFNMFVNECKSKIKDISGQASKPNSENTLSNISSQIISSTSSSKPVHQLIERTREHASAAPLHFSQHLDKTSSVKYCVPNTLMECSTSPSKSRSHTDKSGQDNDRNLFADQCQSGLFTSSLKESKSHPSLHEINNAPTERLPEKFQEYYFTSLHYKGPFKSAFLRNELGGGIHAESKEMINQLSKEDLLISQYSTRHSFLKRNNYRDFSLDLSGEDFNFSKSNSRFSDYQDNQHNYISKTVINPNFTHPKLNFNYESRYKSTFLKASNVKYNESYTTTRGFGHLKYSSAPTDVWAEKVHHWDSGCINALHNDLAKKNWNESANNGYDTSSSDNSSVDDDLNMDDGNSNIEYSSGAACRSTPYHSGDRSMMEKSIMEHKTLQSTVGYSKRQKRSCDSPCCLIHEQGCKNYDIFKPHPHSGLLSTLASRNINGSGNMFGRGGRPGDDLRIGTHLSVRSQMQDSDDDFTSASEDMMSNYTSVKMRNNFPRADSQEMDDTCNHPDAMSYYTGGGPTSQFDVFGGAPQEDLLMNLFPMDDDHATVISSYRQKATSERCSDGIDRTGVDSKPGCSERDSYTTVSNLQPSDKGAFCASRSCFGQGDTSSKKAFTQWYVEDADKNIPIQRRGNEVASKFSQREAWSNAIKTDEKRSEESVDDEGDDGEVDEDDEDEVDDDDEEEDYEDDENEDEEEENGDEDEDGDSDGSRENKQLQVVEDVPGGDARSADKDTGVIDTLETNNQALSVDTKNKVDSGDQRRVHGRLFNQNKYKTYGVKTIRVTSKQNGNQGQIQKYTASNLQGKTGSGYQKFSLEQIKVPAIEKERVRFACDENGDWAEIGRGSYGCVYLGLLDGIVEVAIKDFYESSSWDLVIHEARMLMFLQETGITPKFYGLRRRFDVSKQPSEYCIIMEYFGDGRTLFNVMSDKVPLTKDEWLDIVGQLVAGLRLIHRKNILINDLKADNILIDLTGGRKIIRYIDVGMATYKQGLTFQLPQDQMSKYNFLAPEVREGARTTTRSDIFSLGYMLEQMSRLADPALGGLKKLVARCTDKNPARRPDIDEIVSQVHRFIASKASVTVAQPTSQEQFLLTNSV